MEAVEALRGLRLYEQDVVIRLLQKCSFPPGSGPKRFVRDLGYAPLTRRRWAYAVVLAWKFRRQQPKMARLASEIIERDPHLLDGQWTLPKELAKIHATALLCAEW